MDLSGRFHSGGRWVYWEQETDGETAAENNTVHITTSMQLLFPVVLSAFQQDVDLTLRSVLGAGFSRSSFLRITFCKDVVFLFFFCSSIRTELTACPVSLPHVHKALSCALFRRFISVTKEAKQRQRINACRLDEVAHFKEDECTKSTQLCLLSVRPLTFQVWNATWFYFCITNW